MNLREQQVWRGSHRGLQIKIVRWELDHPIWNYYIYLHEQLVGVKFADIWLTPEVVKFIPESHGWIKYDYYAAPFINVDAWHGGITFYAKHGEIPGHRCVELGCDYNHLWDAESGYSDTLQSVTFDAIATVDQLIAALGISTPPAPTSPPDSPLA